MKTRMIRMVAMVSLFFVSMSLTTAFASDFKGHWAEEVMTSWVEQGFLSSDDEATFRPDEEIMRAQFVDMLNRILNLTETSGISFDDVPENAWFHETVDIAVTAGYAKGVTDTTFAPSSKLTREQAATFVYNALGLAPEPTTFFVDHDLISTWAVPAVGAMNAYGYLLGNGNGEFAPKSFITRAEAVSFLERVRVELDSSLVRQRETVVLTASGTVLENTTISGDLHIAMTNDRDEIFIDDVVVVGDVYIDGEGSNTVFANNMLVYGDVFMNQAGVKLEISGNTQLSMIEIVKSCNIQAKELIGAVQKIVFDTEISKSYRTTLGLNLENVIINAPTSVVIERMVQNISVNEQATGAIVNFSNQAVVGYFDIHTMLTLSGAGSVETLKANCLGITVGSGVLVNTVLTADGVAPPIVSIIDTILYGNQEDDVEEIEIL